MNNQNTKANEQNRLPFTLAGNMGNMIGQLSLQVANLQVLHEDDQKTIQHYKALNAELQNQIDGLRREKMNGQRQVDTAGKQAQR